MAVTARLRALTGKRMRVDAKGLRRAVKDLSDDVGDEIYFKLTDYPPAKPGSHYVRTYDLQQSWRVDVTTPSSGVYLTVKQSPQIRYTVPVHGDTSGGSQWPMHAETGWPLFAVIIENARKKWMAGLQDAYESHPIITWE